MAKRIETSSFKTFIVDKSGKKIVRQYKIGFKGAHAYPRTVPLNKMFKVIDKYPDLIHPKMLKNSFSYIELEYIDGKNLTKEDNPEILKSLIVSYVYNMAKVDCSSMKKFQIWENNSEFLEFQVTNMLNIVHANKEVFEKLELRESFFDKFKGVKLDDTRKLRLIHCDIEPNEIMYNSTNYYLIDWELATCGDLAYELAMSFSQNEFDEPTMEDLVNKVSSYLGENKETLMKDIKIYMEFELVRKAFSAINNVLSNIKKRTTGFDDIIANNYIYYSKLVPTVTKEDLKKRIIMK